jgi:sugar lactone lactonase YvrE
MMLRAALVALTLVAPPSVALHVQAGGGAGVPAVDRGAVWVPNTHDGTVSRVSLGGKVVATIKLGAGTASNGFLDSAVAAGGKVWVARDGAAEIDRIDPVANRVTKRIKVDVRPGGLTAGGGYVWAFHFLGPQVTRIDQATGAKKVFRVDGLAGSGIVYAAGAVWVVSSGSTALLGLDPATGAVRARVELPLPPTPKHGIIDAWWVAAGAGSLWVAEANYDRVVRVTGKVARAIPVPVAAPFGVAFSRGAAWVAGSGKVALIDPATNRATRPLTLAAGSSPVFTQLAAGPSGVWATDYDRGTLYRLR